MKDLGFNDWGGGGGFEEFLLSPPREWVGPAWRFLVMSGRDGDEMQR